MDENNLIYKNQLSIMIIITSITFKVVMLPQYMSIYAKNNSFISMAIMMAIEIVMYILIIYSIGKINLAKHTQDKWLIAPIMALIFALSLLKFCVMFNETVTYISITLFDEGRSGYTLLAFIPVIGYLVYKGGNNIARLSLIVGWLLLATLAFTTLFADFHLDFSNLLPIMPDGAGGVLEGCSKHFLWFGDYIPYLFFSLKKDKKKPNKWSVPVALISVFIFVVGFYILVISIYGNTVPLLNFAFNKIAVFNKISELIGSTSFPVIITWIMMSAIKLAMILYTSVQALAYFVKKKWLAISINIGAIYIIMVFLLKNMEESYMFATGGIRFFVAAAQYSVPILIAIYVKIRFGKEKSPEKEGYEKIIKKQMVNVDTHNSGTGNF